MTSPAAPSRNAAAAAWRLWTALLGMLLALQLSAGAVRPATLAETGIVAAKLNLPAPLAAQLRETGQALKAAAQRPGQADPQDGPGSTPPLPAQATALPARLASADVHFARPADIGPGDSAARAYRARAPPHRV